MKITFIKPIGVHTKYLKNIDDGWNSPKSESLALEAALQLRLIGSEN